VTLYRIGSALPESGTVEVEGIFALIEVSRDAVPIGHSYHPCPVTIMTDSSSGGRCDARVLTFAFLHATLLKPTACYNTPICFKNPTWS